jgi:hypothetical protein
MSVRPYPAQSCAAFGVLVIPNSVVGWDDDSVLNRLVRRPGTAGDGENAVTGQYRQFPTGIESLADIKHYRVLKG